MDRPGIDLGKWKELLGKYRYTALVLLAGVLLLVLPLPTGEEPAADSSTVTAEETGETAALEQRLAEVIGQIDGVGEAEVLVTLSASSRQVLATDETTEEHSTQVETVLTKDGSNGQSTVTVQVVYPTYQGVLVVCDGGDDPTMKLKVLEAVKALTGLGSESISICARAGGS